MSCIIKSVQRHKIFLSQGTVLWMGIKNSIKLAKDCGFDGIEILPTRAVASEQNEIKDLIKLHSVESAHQSWRLDIGLDKKFGIDLISSFFFVILRYIFFPIPGPQRHFLD